MKAILPLFIFIDACGWEIISSRPFACSFAPYRQRLDSVFGYSSACVPSIVSGAWPVEHRNWCYFVYDPKHSPFKRLKPLRWLPKAFTSRRIFRRWLSKLVKAQLGLRGYFDLYNMPFEYLPLFDFAEKKSPLKPGGMNRGPNIFDFLEIRGIPYHASDPGCTETANLASLSAEIEAERIDFAFVYWPELDGLLHRVGNRAPEIGEKLNLYEEWIDRLLFHAQKHYQEIRLYIFSDHGMANCEEFLDLKARIEPLGLRMGEDYAVVYDSTMARFWFFNQPAREKICQQLEQVPQGRILPDSELERLHTLFPDRYFGQVIFLVREGVLIVPSHMGERPICAMHGYHPAEKHSYAALLTNQSGLTEEVTSITSLFRLMTRDAELARKANTQMPAAEPSRRFIGDPELSSQATGTDG
jgi:hypothetical protein